PSEPMYRVHAGVTYGYHAARLFAASGQSQKQEQALRQAVAMFEKLAAEFPKGGHEWRLTDCRVKLGVLLTASGRQREALVEFSKAIDRHPENVEALIQRGRCYRESLQFAKAVKDFSKVIDLDPKPAQSNNELAWLLATCPKAELRQPKRAV